jgi:hypothetical protein
MPKPVGNGCPGGRRSPFTEIGELGAAPRFRRFLGAAPRFRRFLGAAPRFRRFLGAAPRFRRFLGAAPVSGGSWARGTTPPGRGPGAPIRTAKPETRGGRTGSGAAGGHGFRCSADRPDLVSGDRAGWLRAWAGPARLSCGRGFQGRPHPCRPAPMPGLRPVPSPVPSSAATGWRAGMFLQLRRGARVPPGEGGVGFPSHRRKGTEALSAGEGLPPTSRRRKMHRESFTSSGGARARTGAPGIVTRPV